MGAGRSPSVDGGIEKRGVRGRRRKDASGYGFRGWGYGLAEGALGERDRRGENAEYRFAL
jgi:hypothetical protein